MKKGLLVATVGVFHTDRDGHSGGTKANAYQINQLPGSVLCSEMECNCHQNNLSQNSTISALSSTILPWMYTSSTFLSMGGNSVRLVHGVHQLVEQCFPILVQGSPSDADRAVEFADELQSLHETSWKVFEDAISDETGLHDDFSRLPCKRGSKRTRAYAAAWREFRKVFNGWLTMSSTGVVRLQPHY